MDRAHTVSLSYANWLTLQTGGPHDRPQSSRLSLSLKCRLY